MPDSRYTEWLDNAASFYRQRWYLTSGASPSALVAAVAAQSNAGLQQHSGGAVTFVSAPANDAQYPLMSTVAQMLFGCADGSTVQVIVPAPLASIFLPDGLRVDPAAAAAIITAATAVMANNLGSPVTSFRQGSRVERGKEQQ